LTQTVDTMYCDYLRKTVWSITMHEHKQHRNNDLVHSDIARVTICHKQN